MIYFESVKWQNFLSTGNNATEIRLDRSPSTLIVGQNGAGKSTMLDALSFGLFGKPHRDINKPQLVNSINGKGCLVEVCFKIAGHSFKVVRGIKPQKFEIWQNGNMINQSSAARDYQKFLEKNILKLNHKSFHQIVVLGSSSFIPFMQLPAGQRREVIEDLLDIQVFSKMNNILREKQAVIKESLRDNNHQLDLVKQQIDMQRKYIRDITEINDEQIKAKEAEISGFQEEIDALQAANAKASEFISERQESVSEQLNKAHDQKQSLLQYKAQFKEQVRRIVKDAKFYEDNENCPSCSQSIGEDLRQEKITKARDKAKELEQALRDVDEKSSTLEDNLERLNGIAAEIREKSNTISANNTSITRLQGQIRAYENDISNLTGKDGDVGTANKELNKYITDRDTIGERKFQLMDEKSYTDAAAEMLKDTGIKTKVIKQYLPVMNKLVNQYLQILDFFVSFNLDENFNEIIKSRYRDAFNYDSFSEGEKQRIDLALLFTWRQIAKMKNSTSTNLLVLDETFDSSLDHDGIDNLMKILQTLTDDSNVFVISHKGDLLDGKFRSKIEFVKEHNFSKVA